MSTQRRKNEGKNSNLKKGTQFGVTNFCVCSDMNILYPISDIEISFFPFFSSFLSSIQYGMKFAYLQTGNHVIF